MAASGYRIFGITTTAVLALIGVALHLRESEPLAGGGSPSAAVALVGATVIDGTGAAPRPATTLLVREGRIAEVFPSGSRPLPPEAEVVDLRGRYVIPGLIDSHVHLASFDRGNIYPALLRHTLLGGVTSVRDMGGNTPRVGALAQWARADSVQAPRIFYSAVVAGPGWFATYDTARLRYWSNSAPPGRGAGVRLLSEAAQVPEIVAEARSLGATGIKVFSDVPPELLAALAEAAHRAGLRVWSHAVVPPGRPGQLVAAGVDVLSHADQPIWAAAAPGEAIGGRERRSRLLLTVAPAASPAIDSLLVAMRRAGTLLEPTFTVMISGAGREGGTAPLPGDTLYAWSLGLTRRAHALGVPIVAGTDALGTYTPNLHVELQILVERVGLSPLEAIRSATEHGARALGAQDSLGTLAPGKLADLVVLAANPAEDIRNTQTVLAVMKGGRLFWRSEPWRASPLAAPPPSHPASLRPPRRNSARLAEADPCPPVGRVHPRSGHSPAVRGKACLATNHLHTTR